MGVGDLDPTGRQDSPVDHDFVFVVNYSCPRCHAELESRSTGPTGWLRCPSCGRASLPPEASRIDPPPYADEFAGGGGVATKAVPASTFPARPMAMAPMPSPSAPPLPILRLIQGTGFFLTTFLCVFSVLNSKGAQAGTFAIVAVICLVSLIRKPARRDRD